MSTKAGRATPSAFGVIDVGNEWIKVARVRRAGRGVAIESVGAAPHDLVAGDAPAVLGLLVREHKLAALPVYGLLPRQAVNIRIIELPSRDPKEIADMVDLQSTKLTPYTRDEVLVDYRTTVSDRAGYTRVLLLIVQRSALRHRYALLEEAGLRIAQFSVCSEALLNWSRAVLGDLDPATVLVDVDATGAEIAIVDRCGLRFSRGVLVGAEQLSAGDAARERLIEEIRRGVDIVKGEVHDLNVGRIVLTGVSGVPADLGGSLSRSLGIACERHESLTGIKADAQAAEAARRVSLTALTGVALAPGDLSFSLVPESATARMTLSSRAAQLSTMAALIVSALLLGSMAATVRYVSLQRRWDDLRARSDVRQVDVQQTERRQEIAQAVERRQTAHSGALGLLREVHRLVPDAAVVALEQVDVQVGQNQVLVNGTAASIKDIRGFVGSLEQSALFRDVKEGNATTLDAKSQRYRFQVAAQIER
jgi:Tfp pilus assembly PilM family ATPase/Tfp pilus assembly protein PilN